MSTANISVLEKVSPQDVSKLSFDYLKDSSPFKSIIKELLETDNFTECLERTDRRCEVLLLDQENPLGFIVYKKALREDLEEAPSSFEIKSFEILDSVHSLGKNYQKLLLDRVIKLAKRTFANNIILEASESNKFINFFKSNEFSVIKTWKINSLATHKMALLCFPLSKQRISKSSVVQDDSLTPLTSANFKRKRELEVKDEKTGIEREDQPVDTRNADKKRKRESDSEDDSVKKIKKEHKEQESREKRAEERAPRMEMPRRVSEPNFRPPPPRVHNLPMKGTIYFDYIMSGKKKYEGRVCGYACNSMRVGDHLKLFDRRAGWGIICEITSKDQYRGFEEMLRDKGVLPMLPQLEDASRRLSDEGLLREGVKIYQAFPGSQRVHSAGSIAIGVKFIEKIYR
ncbi:MAG: hypothetical protein AB7S94_05860 [Simkaniaceae bacterium]